LKNITEKVKIRKRDIRSEFLSKEILSVIDDKKPMFSMIVLANAIVENCFEMKYEMRTQTMLNRLREHGVLPKSFFRESFLRCTKLMYFMKMNDFDLDDLVDKIINSDLLEEVVMFDRKEQKTFYKLKKVKCHGC